MATKVVKKAVKFESEPLGGIQLLICKLSTLVVAKTLKICVKKGKFPKIKYLQKTFRASMSCFGLPMLTLFVATHLASKLISQDAVRPIKIIFICCKILCSTQPEIKNFMSQRLNPDFTLFHKMNQRCNVILKRFESNEVVELDNINQILDADHDMQDG